MISRGIGYITVISSVVGKVATPYRTIYSSSKHALQGYFDSLRAEVADLGIKITIISPGYVATPVSMNAINSDGTIYGKMDTTTEHGMSPNECANHILNAIMKESSEVILADMKIILGIQLKTLFPEFLAYLMKKRGKTY